MRIGEIRLILNRLAELYSAGGAKGPAADLKTFSDVLGPHGAKSVEAFCADTNNRLRQAAEKPKGRKKASASKASVSLDSDVIGRYVTLLRSAGTDRGAFDAVFDKLKADKAVKAPVLAEVARQYADSVTKYKSMAAAHSDISKAFLRRARFENKLR